MKDVEMISLQRTHLQIFEQPLLTELGALCGQMNHTLDKLLLVQLLNDCIPILHMMRSLQNGVGASQRLEQSFQGQRQNPTTLHAERFTCVESIAKWENETDSNVGNVSWRWLPTTAISWRNLSNDINESGDVVWQQGLNVVGDALHIFILHLKIERCKGQESGDIFSFFIYGLTDAYRSPSAALHINQKSAILVCEMLEDHSMLVLSAKVAVFDMRANGENLQYKWIYFKTWLTHWQNITRKLPYFKVTSGKSATTNRANMEDSWGFWKWDRFEESCNRECSHDIWERCSMQLTVFRSWMHLVSWASRISLQAGALNRRCRIPDMELAHSSPLLKQDKTQFNLIQYRSLIDELEIDTTFQGTGHRTRTETLPSFPLPRIPRVSALNLYPPRMTFHQMRKLHCQQPGGTTPTRSGESQREWQKGRILTFRVTVALWRSCPIRPKAKCWVFVSWLVSPLYKWTE